MTCVICRVGEMHVGRVNVTLERGSTTVLLRDVPAEVCDNCGEYYLSEETTRRVLALAEDAVRRGTEIEILRYAA